MIDNDRPAYRVLAIHGFFGPDDNLYNEGDEIYFDGVPNDELEPLNSPARTKLAEHLEFLDALGREAALKAGKAYAGRPRTLDGGLMLATAVMKADMGLMGAKKDTPEITRLDSNSSENTPETGNRGKRGRPRKDSLSIHAA